MNWNRKFFFCIMYLPIQLTIMNEDEDIQEYDCRVSIFDGAPAAGEDRA